MPATLGQLMQVKSQFREAAEKIGLSDGTINSLEKLFPNNRAVESAVKKGDVAKLFTILKKNLFPGVQDKHYDLFCNFCVEIQQVENRGLFPDEFIQRPEHVTEPVLKHYLLTGQAQKADLTLYKNKTRLETRLGDPDIAGTPKVQTVSLELREANKLYSELRQLTGTRDFKENQRRFDQEKRSAASASKDS